MNSIDVLNIITLALIPFCGLVYLLITLNRAGVLQRHIVIQRRLSTLFFVFLYFETLILSSLFDVGSTLGIMGITLLTIFILIAYYFVDRRFVRKLDEDRGRH